MGIPAVRVTDFAHLKEPGQFILETLYPPDNLRDLTDDEKEVGAQFGYVKYQEYAGNDGIVGKFWTQPELDAIAAAGGPLVTGLIFRCPCGCGAIGGIGFGLYPQRPKWDWDGNKDKPTCTPSIQRSSDCKWHGYLRNGVFEPC